MYDIIFREMFIVDRVNWHMDGCNWYIYRKSNYGDIRRFAVMYMVTGYHYDNSWNNKRTV